MTPAAARVLRSGLVSGLAGYASISLFFAIFDGTRGDPPWHTLGLLGTTLFGSARGVLGPFIAYNGVHLFAFLIIGVVVALLIEEIEWHPEAWYVPLFAGVVLFIVSVPVLALLIGPLADLGATVIALAEGIALAAMLLLLLPQHAGILVRIEAAQG